MSKSSPNSRRRWTDEQLAEAVKSSRSVNQVFQKLGLKVGGGQHLLLKTRIKFLNLDTSHFLGKGWNKGNIFGLKAKTIPLELILVKESSYLTTTHLKRRLLKEGILENRCYQCGLDPVWHGKPLVLRLDHINGERQDNRKENLRLLCPNCDSQTDTFAGRNRKNNKKRKAA